jgi:glycosyltransferase involved in cell wall biosynthesis
MNNLVKNKAKVSVIILTLNEEKNIRQCLQSMDSWTYDIHIVDSNSTDNTVEIAKEYTTNIHMIEEGHWANIRNWAMSSIPLKYDWVMFVDADEWLTEGLKSEINQKLNSTIEENGFYIRRKFIFLNKWLRHGRMYSKVLRLFKHEKTEYTESGDVEYPKVEGKVGLLNNDMVHQDLKPFSSWVDKHNKISLRAAKRYIEIKDGKKELLYKSSTNETIEGGDRHWVRENIWDHVPLLSRPFLMFFYTYFINLGFLDGKEGLIYHLNHAFVYELLISTQIKEIEIKRLVND